MHFYRISSTALTLALVFPSCATALGESGTGSASNLHEAFEKGEVQGTLRAYHNLKSPDEGDTLSTFATGGNIRAQTAPLAGVSSGVGFHVSEDLNLQDEDPAERNANLPEKVNILGEAWLQFATEALTLRFGRQKVDTPFANPSDAFLIPVLYEAVALSVTPFHDLTVSAHFVDRIKGRPDDDFEQINQFALNRYGIDQRNDEGMWIAGLRYGPNPTELQAWAYGLPDLFHLYFVQGDHRFGSMEGLRSRVSAQIVHASDDGEALAGKVNARGFGMKLSAGFGIAEISAAWNRLLDDEQAFLVGGLPAPFNFATSPLYTNSMTQTLENSAPGDAYKLTILGQVSAMWTWKISYGEYNRNGGVDSSETDADVAYRFSGSLDGLSMRLRVGLIDSDNDAASFTEVRSQIQYQF